MIMVIVYQESCCACSHWDPLGPKLKAWGKSCIVFNDDDDDENARLWSLQYISDDPSFDNEAEINEMIPGQRGGWGVFMFRT